MLIEGSNRKELILRDKASAGASSTPLMCLMSDVNWSM